MASLVNKLNPHGLPLGKLYLFVGKLFLFSHRPEYAAAFSTYGESVVGIEVDGRNEKFIDLLEIAVLLLDRTELNLGGTRGLYFLRFSRLPRFPRLFHER